MKIILDKCEPCHILYSVIQITLFFPDPGINHYCILDNPIDCSYISIHGGLSWHRKSVK